MSGTVDITMMPTVVDVAGINSISRRIYANAAGAIAGMVSEELPELTENKPLITASMFGNTTACVTRAQHALEAQGYEVLVFHATGTGGKTMESLIASGFITASLDITTTELADYVCGGVLSAGPDRMLAAARAGIPTVLAPGLRGHVQLLGHRDRAGEVPGAQPVPVEPQRHADAHHRRGERAHRRDDRGGGQCVERARWRSCCRSRASRSSTARAAMFWDPEADAACYDAIKAQPQARHPGDRDGLQHQRSGVCGQGGGSCCWGCWVNSYISFQKRNFVMAFITREEALKRLRAQVAAGKPIVGCGAGTGISAKCAEAGGADLIIIYNSGRYRMAGRGSLAGLLPYGDANGIVVEMAAEVLPVVKNTPVLAGVNGTDPFRLMPVFLKQLKEMGFTGVQNFPTVGLIDGNFRANLEATGMGYDKEIETIAEAHELDLLTTPYVFDPDAGEGDGQGRRGHAGGARRADHRRHDRRRGGADAGRGDRAGAGRLPRRGIA